MKKTLASVILTAALLFTGPQPQGLEAAPQASFELFYASLAPFGEWVDVGDYGYCWHPTDVSADWRPYTEGHWVYTDAGWTWDSDEPFGWAVFHYGRWFHLSETGWCWVPDTEWAPAWVSFRHDSQFIGWAPLPPEARLWASIGLGNWVDGYYDIGPSRYCFVPFRRFAAPLARAVILRPERNLEFFASTSNVTNIIKRENVTFVGGPGYDAVASKSEWPVKRLKLERQTDLGSTDGVREAKSRIENNRLVIPAPKISSSTAVQPPGDAKRVAMSKVEHGWEKAGDPSKVQELKAKTKRESRLPDALPPEPKFDKALQVPPNTGKSADSPPVLKLKKPETPPFVPEEYTQRKVVPQEGKHPSIPGDLDRARQENEKRPKVEPQRQERVIPLPDHKPDERFVPKREPQPGNHQVPKTDSPAVTPRREIAPPGIVPRSEGAEHQKRRGEPHVGPQSGAPKGQPDDPKKKSKKLHPDDPSAPKN